MHLRRPILLAVGVLLSVSALGCASAGPDLRGPEGPNLMAAYSGDWILDPELSEDLDGKMRESMRVFGEPGAGGMTGGRSGGGRGGMTGGGGRGGMRPGGGLRGGMPGEGMDREEMRRSMEAIRGLARVPAELSITLQPEMVTLAQGVGNITSLTLGAREEKLRVGEATLEATARWTQEGIEINREMEMGGGIRDRIGLDESGNLIVKREVDLMSQSEKGTLVYRRKS